MSMKLVKLSELLHELIKASEKAAQIARSCRAEEQLFKLLVQEKSPDTKNPRFVQDFKTLADVLVQETVRHDLCHKFPEMKSNIHGEENNKFMNMLGESIVVCVQDNIVETTQLLLKVLDDNEVAAHLLAKVVHSNEITISQESLLEINQDQDIELDLNEIAIWIDPIDSTSEYVSGSIDTTNDNEIITAGLSCVTCLIGVFNKSNGSPLIGVISQPFHTFQECQQQWEGKYIWGFKVGDKSGNNLRQAPGETSELIFVGGNETESVIDLLSKENKVVYAAGAGYKMLCVAQGLGDAFVSSQATTFKWDTCAPHAILNSLGGGIVSYLNVRQHPYSYNVQESQLSQLNYLANPKTESDDQVQSTLQLWCNKEGVIAYKNFNSLQRVIKSFTSN